MMSNWGGYLGSFVLGSRGVYKLLTIFLFYWYAVNGTYSYLSLIRFSY